MVTVHEHLRLDDWDQSRFLTQGRITSQRMRVGLDATAAGNAVAYCDHRAPLGKARAHSKVLPEAVAQSIQTFGDFLSGITRQVLCAGVDFDAGNDSRIGEDFNKGSAILLLLADGLVVED